MAENDAALGLPANMPESVRARIMAARLLQQGAAQQTAPYTSKGVVGLKAIEGLMGGLQERQILQDAQRGAMAGNASLVDLANALRSGASSSAMGIPTSAAAANPAPASAPASSLPHGHLPFFASIAPDANRVAGQLNVDPRLVMAQAALESNYGRSAPGNNLFGIKGQGSGPVATHESVNGQLVPTMASFAAYDSPSAAFDGYGKLLSGPRYAGVRNAQGLDAQIAALGKSGYATDPNYAAKVGAIARSIPLQSASSAAAPIGDSAALAAQNRITSGQGSDADRALLVNYRQQQNTPQPAPQRTASADVPAPNAQPVASSTLPPGVTAADFDRTAAPASPYGSMPTSMVQAPATPDAATMAAALRGQATGSGPGATPLPATVQPLSPFGAMPTSMAQAPASVPAPSMVGAPPPSPMPSPFGAGPQPMAPQGDADPAMVAQLLKRGAPTPAAGSPAPDPSLMQGAAPGAPQTPPLSPNALAMGDLMPGGPGPAALDPSAGALPAAGLSTGQLPGFDNFAGAPDGTVRQTSLVSASDPTSAPGFTGSFGPGIQPQISGTLPPPDMLAQGSADMPSPASPSPAVMAAALRNAPPPVPTPSPAPQAPSAAPTPPPSPAGQQAAALLPGGVDDFGRTPDQAAAGPMSLPDVTTAAMAKAGYDTTGLPGAQPKPATPPLPTMAGANVPPPDLSGLAGSPTPPAGSGLPAMTAANVPPPTRYTSTEPTSRPGADAMRQPKPGDAGGPPLPVPRPSNAALGLDPDAPAPNAVQAGPAPVSPQVMGSMLRQQPMGIAGNSPTSDPSSAVNFNLQQAQRAQGGPGYSSPGARALAGQGVTSATQPQGGGSPLDALGSMFNMGAVGGGAPSSGAGEGGGLGGLLSGLPIIGSMFGGQGQQGQMGNGFPTGGNPSPTSAPASSSAYGGQGQGQSFAPGGQGGQPGAVQGGQGQAAQGGGLARAQQIAGAILQNPYASPQAQEAASRVLFSMPSYQKMDDGTLLMTDPLTRQTTVVGRYGKPEVLKPGDALRDPYTGAPIGPTQATPDRFKEGANGSILDQTTGRTAADPNAFTMSEVEVNGVKVPVRIGRNADGSPNVQMMVPGAGAQQGAPAGQPGATPSGGPLDGMAPLVRQANDMAARQAAAKEGAVDQVKGANTFVQATAKQSAEAANHVQEMQQLKALGAAAPTGWSADMARYAADHGFQTATGDAVKSYDGMRAYLGTQLRQAGSGALRNSEMDKLSDALGSTNVSPATRAAAVQRIQDGFARQSALGQVASDPSLPDPMAKQARIQDVQQTWMNADAAIEAHPDKRAAIIAKMQAAGYPVVGF